MIDGKFQRRHARKLPDPVVPQPIELLALQPLPLPGGKIGVLDRQLGQRRRPPRLERRIQHLQFPQQHGHRPAVIDHVVRADHRHMVVVREPEHRDPDQRAGLQVERPPHLFGDPLAQPGFALLRGQAAQIDPRKRARRSGLDYLDRAAVHVREPGPQGLVAAEDLVEGPFDDGDVQPALDPQGGIDGVRRPAALQLVEEPERFLGERGEHFTRGSRHRHDRGTEGAMAAGDGGIDPLGQLGDRRRLEHLSQGQVGVPAVGDPRNHSRGQQRMSAQRKEIVVPPYQNSAARSTCRTSCQISASTLSVSFRGATYATCSSGRDPEYQVPASTVGRALRSTLPLAVKGIESSATNAAGIMKSGSRVRRNLRNSSEVGACRLCATK